MLRVESGDACTRLNEHSKRHQSELEKEGNAMRVAIGGCIAAANSFVGYRMDLAQFPRSTLTRDAVFKMRRGETASLDFYSKC